MNPDEKAELMHGYRGDPEPDVPHVPTPYEVETFSGRYVDTSNPRADTIDLVDIAHALSQTCRYGGHCSEFYSVAEHAVYVSIRLARQGYDAGVQLAGLHHDDSEAYLGDIPRPLKGLLGPAYAALTKQMDETIRWQLNLNEGVPSFHDVRVKDSDNWMLFVEAKHLLPSKGINWSGSQLDDWGVRQDGLPKRIVTPTYWRVAKDDPKGVFLERHKTLMEALS